MGRAYLFIGRLYASSVNCLWYKDEFEKRMAYVRSSIKTSCKEQRRVDPSISVLLQESIQEIIRANFPSKKVIFTAGDNEYWSCIHTSKMLD